MQTTRTPLDGTKKKKQKTGQRGDSAPSSPTPSATGSPPGTATTSRAGSRGASPSRTTGAGTGAGTAAAAGAAAGGPLAPPPGQYAAAAQSAQDLAQSTETEDNPVHYGRHTRGSTAPPRSESETEDLLGVLARGRVRGQGPTAAAGAPAGGFAAAVAAAARRPEAAAGDDPPPTAGTLQAAAGGLSARGQQPRGGNLRAGAAGAGPTVHGTGGPTTRSAGKDVETETALNNAYTTSMMIWGRVERSAQKIKELLDKVKVGRIDPLDVTEERYMRKLAAIRIGWLKNVEAYEQAHAKAMELLVETRQDLLQDPEQGEQAQQDLLDGDEAYQKRMDDVLYAQQRLRSSLLDLTPRIPPDLLAILGLKDEPTTPRSDEPSVDYRNLAAVVAENVAASVRSISADLARAQERRGGGGGGGGAGGGLTAEVLQEVLVAVRDEDGQDERAMKMIRAAKAPAIEVRTFSGSDDEDYMAFQTDFKAMYERACDTTERERYTLLFKHLKGPARRLLADWRVDDSTYKKAWEELDKMYGGQAKVIGRVNRNFKKMKPVKDIKSVTDFRLVYQAIDNLVITYKGVGATIEGQYMIPDWLDKLPSQVRTEWAKECIKDPDLEGDAMAFLKIVERMLRTSEKVEQSIVRPADSTTQSKPKETGARKKESSGSALSAQGEEGLGLAGQATGSRSQQQRRGNNSSPQTGSTSQKGGKSSKKSKQGKAKAPSFTCSDCANLTDKHDVRSCAVFKGQTGKLRREQAWFLKLCRRCLGRGHFIQDCTSQVQCKEANCKTPTKHHSLLHA